MHYGITNLKYPLIPLNWLRKALILALNDSAEAFVNRSSK